MKIDRVQAAHLLGAVFTDFVVNHEHAVPFVITDTTEPGTTLSFAITVTK